MTTKARRQLWLLAALVVVAVLIAVLRPSPAPVATQTAAAQPAQSRSSRSSEPVVGDLRLDLLEGAADDGAEPERNLFRFEARRSAAEREAAERPPVVARVEPPPELPPPPPPGPPPPPPIPLRYIGYVDEVGQVPRVAVLSDGRGNVFNGKEGDIIEGRYRVLRIGTDSADLIYVDGRGRQTIRLSGQ